MNKIRKAAVNIIKKVINTLGWVYLAINNKDKALPVYGKNTVQGLKVHVGPGQINLQGWVNVDAREFEHIHIVDSDMKFDSFTDSSVQEIYMCHILEHLSFLEIENLLALINKKLKPGGVVRLSVPNFDSILKIYQASGGDINKIKHILMGGQDYEFNFHKSVFNNTSLFSLLAKHGFGDIVEWDTLEDFGVNLGDWSNGKIKTSDGPVSVSLNLKAKKNV